MKAKHFFDFTTFFVLFAAQRFSCDGLDCGFPGVPYNGELLRQDVERFVPGDAVEYGCAEGYVIFGDEKRRCQEDGLWSGTMPECKFNLALGKPSLQSSTLWSYEANLAVDGNPASCSFTPRGSEQRWWQVHLGADQPNVIQAVAVAITPGSYQHFTIFVIELLEGNKALYKPCSKFDGKFESSKAVFLCANGEGHKGQFVYIRDDREEQEYFGLCEVEVFKFNNQTDCGEPERPLSSKVSRLSLQIAEYSCLKGFKLERLDEYEVIRKHTEDEDAESDLQTSSIVVEKGSSPPRRKEIKAFKNETEKTGVISTSNNEFYFTEVVRRSCQRETGTWLPKTIPSCIEVHCNHPASTKDGFIEVSNFRGSYVFGSLATYHCNPGYILWGNASRLCTKEGTWSGNTPQCKPITCGHPPAVDNARAKLVNGSTLWQSLAAYECQPGYRMELLHSKKQLMYSNPAAGGRNNKKNVTSLIVTSSCLESGVWESGHFKCSFDPSSSLAASFGSSTSGSKGGGLLDGWTTLGGDATWNFSVIVTIAVISTLAILSLVIMIVFFTHRKMMKEETVRKISQTSTSELISHNHKNGGGGSGGGDNGGSLAQGSIQIAQVQQQQQQHFNPQQQQLLNNQYPHCQERPVHIALHKNGGVLFNTIDCRRSTRSLHGHQHVNPIHHTMTLARPSTAQAHPKLSFPANMAGDININGTFPRNSTAAALLLAETDPSRVIHHQTLLNHHHHHTGGPLLQTPVAFKANGQEGQNADLPPPLMPRPTTNTLRLPGTHPLPQAPPSVSSNGGHHRMISADVSVASCGQRSSGDGGSEVDDPDDPYSKVKGLQIEPDPPYTTLVRRAVDGGNEDQLVNFASNTSSDDGGYESLHQHQEALRLLQQQQQLQHQHIKPEIGMESSEVREKVYETLKRHEDHLLMEQSVVTNQTSSSSSSHSLLASGASAMLGQRGGGGNNQPLPATPRTSIKGIRSNLNLRLNSGASRSASNSDRAGSPPVLPTPPPGLCDNIGDLYAKVDKKNRKKNRDSDTSSLSTGTSPSTSDPIQLQLMQQHQQQYHHPMHQGRQQQQPQAGSPTKTLIQKFNALTGGDESPTTSSRGASPRKSSLTNQAAPSTPEPLYATIGSKNRSTKAPRLSVAKRQDSAASTTSSSNNDTRLH